MTERTEEFDMPCPHCGKTIPVKVVTQVAGAGGMSGANNNGEPPVTIALAAAPPNTPSR